VPTAAATMPSKFGMEVSQIAGSQEKGKCDLGQTKDIKSPEIRGVGGLQCKAEPVLWGQLGVVPGATRGTKMLFGKNKQSTTDSQATENTNFPKVGS